MSVDTSRVKLYAIDIGIGAVYGFVVKWLWALVFFWTHLVTYQPGMPTDVGWTTSIAILCAYILFPIGIASWRHDDDGNFFRVIGGYIASLLLFSRSYTVSVLSLFVRSAFPYVIYGSILVGLYYLASFLLRRFSGREETNRSSPR